MVPLSSYGRCGLVSRLIIKLSKELGDFPLYFLSSAFARLGGSFNISELVSLGSLQSIKIIAPGLRDDLAVKLTGT